MTENSSSENTATRLPAPPDDQRHKELYDAVIADMLSSVKLLDKIRPDLVQTDKEITKSFWITRLMYTVVFVMGVALIVGAALIGFYTGKNEFSLIFGSVGVVELISVLLKDPPLQIQNSRAYLTRLHAAYYTWLVDSANWSIFLYNFSREGKNYTMQVADMQKASDSYAKTFRETLGTIGPLAQTETPKTESSTTQTESSTTPSSPTTTATQPAKD